MLRERAMNLCGDCLRVCGLREIFVSVRVDCGSVCAWVHRCACAGVVGPQGRLWALSAVLTPNADGRGPEPRLRRNPEKLRPTMEQRGPKKRRLLGGAFLA